jgi:hypothetical protein
MPSWLEDIQVTSAISSSDTTIDVVDYGYDDYWDETLTEGKFIRFWFPDGTFACREIDSAPSSTQLTLKTAVGTDVTTDELPFLQVSFLYFSRFASDILAVKCRTEEVREIDTAFVSIPEAQDELSPNYEEMDADDGTDSYYYFSTQGYRNTTIRIGNYTGSTLHASYWFENVAIPNGATIVSAVMNFSATSSLSATTVNVRFQFEDADDPAAVSSISDYDSRTLYSSYVDWDDIGGWTNTQTYTSPDLKDILQEVVNDSGWGSGQNMQIFIQDNGSTSSAYRQAHGTATIDVYWKDW